MVAMHKVLETMRGLRAAKPGLLSACVLGPSRSDCRMRPSDVPGWGEGEGEGEGGGAHLRAHSSSAQHGASARTVSHHVACGREGLVTKVCTVWEKCWEVVSSVKEQGKMRVVYS